MQRLISRIGHSSHNGRNISCSTVAHASTGAVAGGQAAAASRRLMKGNAVTGLYSTIFAVAVLLDIGAKDRHVKEWEKQLAAVKAEMLELQVEEARLLHNLEARRKVRRLALPMQKRYYSSISNGSKFGQPGSENRPNQVPPSPPLNSAHNIAPESTPTPGNDPVITNAQSQDTSSLPKSVESSAPDSIEIPKDISEIMDFETDETQDPFREEGFAGNKDLSTGDAFREEAIRRLAVRTLAIKLLLRPRIAHTYGSTPLPDYDEIALPRSRTGELLAELEATKKRILKLKFNRNISYSDIVEDVGLQQRENLRQERAQLTDELRDAFVQYFKGEMSLTELVLVTAKNLLSSEEPVSSQTIELLITQYSRARQNDIVRLILESLLPNKFYITVPIIVSTINHFNKTKDLFGFDGFMRFLQGLSAPIKMPVLWQTVTISGVDVAVPTNARYPHVMNALVAAALSFDQPQRADAWLQVLRETGYAEAPEVMGAYLRYYSMTPNWEKGRHVLLRAVAYLMSATSPLQHKGERLILYMIILCNCCGQHELSQKIVMAAAANGIDWYQGFTPRDIRLSVRLAVSQWKLAIEKSRETAFLSKPLGECYYDFARAIEADVRRAADAEVVDHSTKEREQREKQEEDSFRVRLAEKTMKGEKQNDAQEPASQNPQEPPPKPVKTNSETKPLDPSLQRNMDYVTYSLKVSDMSINDLKMELDMESRRAQLAELKSQLATLKQSVHV